MLCLPLSSPTVWRLPGPLCLPDATRRTHTRARTPILLFLWEHAQRHVTVYYTCENSNPRTQLHLRPYCTIPVRMGWHTITQTRTHTDTHAHTHSSSTASLICDAGAVEAIGPFINDRLLLIQLIGRRVWKRCHSLLDINSMSCLQAVNVYINKMCFY